jgi:predicted glycoside hydrolase/deacetylase ChbG (UPF0249 family)
VTARDDSPAPAVRVAVCIDDIGMHPGIAEAALALGAAGRVSALSCMSDGPAWRDAARTLKPALGDRVDLGLHLNFTEPWSRSRLRRPLKSLIAAAYARALDPVAVRNDIRRQLDDFEDAAGAPPDFVDGHEHVHQLPVIREALVSELAVRYRQHKPWLRDTGAPPASGALPLSGERIKERVIEALGAGALRSLARQAGFAQNRHLLGVYGLSGSLAGYVARWRAWCSRAGDGDLLMCHPAAGIPGPDVPLARARRLEFEALRNNEPVSGARRIEVVRLSDWIAGRAQSNQK